MSGARAKAIKAFAGETDEIETMMRSGAHDEPDTNNGTGDKYARRRRRLARRLAFVVIGVGAWSLVAWAASRALIVESDTACESNAIVVLAGADSYQERTARAAELYHHGCAPHIVLTNDGVRGGWSQTEQRNLLFVESASRQLERAGVPPSRVIVLPQTVSGTYDEAERVRDAATERDWQRITIVTSPYHTRRAWRSFRQAFRDKQPDNTTQIYCRASRFNDAAAVVWWLDARGWRDVAGEYVKFAYYFCRMTDASFH
ncbi:MAG: YdcF family protein [Pyrinomonadaceae bacterium MAG19_C2-C3]|nr:YdcF family protein [Pyrinomonadaceae bacterium MAG19_C2-C3]